MPRSLPGPGAGFAACLVAACGSVLCALPARARPAADARLAPVASALRDAAPPARGPGRPEVERRPTAADIELRFRTLTPAVVARAAALGATVTRVSFRYGRLVARAPLAALPDLAALPGLSTIHPLYGAVGAAGAVTSQAVATLRADQARERFGVDGSGVRVGILSDTVASGHGGAISGSGCERALSGSAPQQSGDLPPLLSVIDPGRSGIDEGSGMAEIVHDIAPGATLSFATAYPDEATFAENILALRACGADVIVDDVLYFAEPMFQDGIVAQAATDVVADGALFVSATANLGHAGIAQVFRDSDPRGDAAALPSGANLHNFGDGDRFATVRVPARCSLRVILQWAEPFSGTLGAGASTDLDLFLYADDDPAARILASGTDTQGCSAPGGGRAGDPFETAVFVAGRDSEVHIAVDRACGDAPVPFRVVAFASQCLPQAPPLEFEPGRFDGPQMFGHPTAAAALAVAAVDQREVASDGAYTAPPGILDVQAYSARGGPLSFFFAGDGTPLGAGPEVRFKPDLAAPDGGDTAYFGVDADGNGWPNFFGTSAAAPAVAAVAALLIEAAPHRERDHLVAAMRATAREAGVPGRDPLAGDGLVDAGAALAALVAAPPGDCDGDGRVVIAELLTGVRIALGEAALARCPPIDADGDGAVTVAELLRAIAAALQHA